jgi:hypothetical protein
MKDPPKKALHCTALQYTASCGIESMMIKSAVAGKALCGKFGKAPESSDGTFLQPASPLWF